VKADNLVRARKLLDIAPPAPEPDEPGNIAAEPPTPLNRPLSHKVRQLRLQQKCL
jgi:hypothetical protein